LPNSQLIDLVNQANCELLLRFRKGSHQALCLGASQKSTKNFRATRQIVLIEGYTRSTVTNFHEIRSPLLFL
jgi:hypothetical protein